MNCIFSMCVNIQALEDGMKSSDGQLSCRITMTRTAKTLTLLRCSVLVIQIPKGGPAISALMFQNGEQLGRF